MPLRDGAHKVLCDLILDLFRGPALPALVRGLSGGAGLADELPDVGHVGRRAFVSALVDALDSRGLVNEDLFDVFRDRRPKQVAKIDAARDAVLGPAPTEPVWQRLGGVEAREWLGPLMVRSRQVRSVIGRLLHPDHGRLGRSAGPPLEVVTAAPLEWYLQRDYHEGHRDVDRPDRRRHRLVLTERSSDGRSLRPVLAIVFEQPGGTRGRKPPAPQVVTLQVPNVRVVLGTPAFLLGADTQLFLPWLDPEPFPGFGYPYLAQAPQAFRCLDSCVWMALQYARRHLGGTALPMEQIIGGRRPQQRHPIDGATYADVHEVLRAAGFAVMDVWVDRDGRVPPHLVSGGGLRGGARLVGPPAFVEILHVAVDSQLPVILLFQRHRRDFDRQGGLTGVAALGEQGSSRHAVVVVGHTTYLPSAARPSSKDREAMRAELGWGTTTDHLDAFVVHDDDLAPWMLLPASGPGYAVDEATRPHCLFGESVEQDAVGMFVLLPPSVEMTLEQALVVTKNVLGDTPWERWYAREGVALTDGVEEFRAAWRDRKLVLSLFLESEARLRKNIALDIARLGEAASADFGDLWLERLPPFVYVVEISTEGRLGDLERRVIGELVIDPTEDEDPARCLLHLRVPGMVRSDTSKARYRDAKLGSRPAWLLRNFR